MGLCKIQDLRNQPSNSMIPSGLPARAWVFRNCTNKLRRSHWAALEPGTELEMSVPEERGNTSLQDSTDTLKVSALDRRCRNTSAGRENQPPFLDCAAS
eukprot:6488254-Amphidinium_carterae.1